MTAAELDKARNLKLSAFWRGMATINGNDRNNVLPGTSEADTINGFDGNDVLHGYAGDDTLNGGAGDDTLYGYEGADALNGDAGNDLIFTGRPDLFDVPVISFNELNPAVALDIAGELNSAPDSLTHQPEREFAE